MAIIAKPTCPKMGGCACNAASELMQECDDDTTPPPSGSDRIDPVQDSPSPDDVEHPRMSAGSLAMDTLRRLNNVLSRRNVTLAGYNAGYNAGRMKNDLNVVVTEPRRYCLVLALAAVALMLLITKQRSAEQAATETSHSLKLQSKLNPRLERRQQQFPGAGGNSEERLPEAAEQASLKRLLQQRSRIEEATKRTVEETEERLRVTERRLQDKAGALRSKATEADLESHRSAQAAHGFDELAPLGSLRFQPRTYDQYRAAVLTLWNVLDRVVTHASVGNKAAPGTPFGYMRVVQLEAYSRLIWQRRGEDLVYCEVGFNGGHGVTAMLLAAPRLTAVSFELGDRPYTAEAVRLLQSYFGPERLIYMRGDSTKTVPAYTESADHLMCDVVLVDGDHSAKGAYRDLINMGRLAKPNAVLLIDDINEGPGKALRGAERDNIVRDVDWHEYNATSPENPCIRRVRPNIDPSLRRFAKTYGPSQGHWHCSPHWGWATARYVRGR